MPEKKTLERARKDAREGKAPSTQAGEFVREEIEHIREGKHGARSAKQAIAIGLSSLDIHADAARRTIRAVEGQRTDLDVRQRRGSARASQCWLKCWRRVWVSVRRP